MPATLVTRVSWLPLSPASHAACTLSSSFSCAWFVRCFFFLRPLLCHFVPSRDHHDAKVASKSEFLALADGTYRMHRSSIDLAGINKLIDAYWKMTSKLWLMNLWDLRMKSKEGINVVSYNVRHKYFNK